MLDIKFIREHPTQVRDNLKKRQQQEKVKWVDELIQKDKEWRKLKADVDKLRSQRNKASQDINQAKKQGKNIKAIVMKAKKIPEYIVEKEKKMVILQKEMHTYLLNIPNMLDKSVPKGVDDTNNKTIKVVGRKPKFSFTPKHHADIVRPWVDLERGAKIAGARWYFLNGDLALLEMALSRYAIDFMIDKKFELSVPPHMINRKSYEGVVTFDAFEDVLYKTDENLYAIATAEHPLTAQFMNETLSEKELPLKIVGYSTNFRKEAGSHGKDTKGIFRVHQFNKVEQILISNQEDSEKYHEEMIKNAMQFFKSLGLHYKQVLLCSGDTGSTAAKTYDLEVWFPAQKKYREVVSVSNCANYQARRLRIKYGKSKKFVHTLNGTCVATSRALCAILENFQQKDGSIKIPKPLIKYLPGMKKLKAR